MANQISCGKITYEEVKKLQQKKNSSGQNKKSKRRPSSNSGEDTDDLSSGSSSKSSNNNKFLKIDDNISSKSFNKQTKGTSLQESSQQN